MDSSAIKEELSICYISAVSANAGIAYDIQRHDSDSTDGIIKEIINLPGQGKFNAEIRIQLKSTVSENICKQYDDKISYQLKVKNYNDLCRKGTAPIILCLLVLPLDQDQWVHWSKNDLLIRGCMYWKSFEGEEPSSNKENITVVFDKSNVVNSDTLQELLEKVAREERL